MSRASGIVTLLSDFGHNEPFVGVVKGVLLSHAPQLVPVDLTHEIAAYDVALGSFWLAQAAPYFPRGTVHLAVVDPGVGSERRALLAEASGHVFVVPDNGLLSDVAALGPLQVFAVPPADGASATFHARDVFAPLAARLASGAASAADLGEPCQDWVRFDVEVPKPIDGGFAGRVIAVDRFGNLLSNLRVPRGERPQRCFVTSGHRGKEVRVPFVSNYAAGPVAAPIALINAWGLVEIAVNLGNAAELLSVARGATVRVELAPA